MRTLSAAKGRAFLEQYGPWAFVAGASEGLGEAFARALGELGFNLILCARRKQVLEVVGSEIAGQYGVVVRPVVLDLASGDLAAEVSAVIADLEVGVLVYNAGLSLIGELHASSLEQHQQLIDVNCRGPLVLSYLLSAPMRQRGRGGIVLMSSMAGFQGTPLISTYAASKGFNRVFGESLNEEFRSSGVDVLVCSAGATKTPNFERSKPKRVSAPIMTPRAVANEALAALGRRPELVPGRFNRFAAFLMQRVFPRRLAIRIMGRSTRQMYGG